MMRNVASACARVFFLTVIYCVKILELHAAEWRIFQTVKLRLYIGKWQWSHRAVIVLYFRDS